MKPSPYSILDNRPIDQWKVTELKDELKRRKLPLKGLKDDLVRRLDEALRAEMESVSGRIEDADNFQHPISQVQIESGKTPTANTTSANEPEQVNFEAAKDRGSDTDSKSFGQFDVVDGNDDAGSTGDEVLGAAHASLLVTNDQSVTEARKMATVNTTDASEAEQVNFDTSMDRETDVDVDSKTSGQVDVDVDSSENDAARSTGEKGQEAVHTSSLQAQDELVIENVSTDVINSSENKSFSSILDVPTSENDHSEKGQEAVDTSPLLANDELVIKKHSADIVNLSESMLSSSILDVQASENDHTRKLNLNSSSQTDSEDIKQPNEDVKHHLSDMNNQVSEVSPSFGLPENNNSISTDSMSINEKIDALKDNVIADDVKLEPDVKPEMVEPSSSQVVSGGGESHPMDVEAPHENKVSVEVSDNNVTNVVVSRKNCNADLGSPEKLNLDRSSGDDSMEEDTLESKQVDFICNSNEVGERSEKNEMPSRKEDNLVDVGCDDVCIGKNDYGLAKTKAAAASAEKRKLPDEQTAVFDGPSKRQRRWKNGNAVATELQYSTPSMATTRREAPQARSLSGKNSNVNTETPKERDVPPATNSPTDSLRIDNFLRPFTLKAVQELLGKTGTVAHFWMDHIKTHCYVTYSSVEEAIETRNAVYNLQWPPNGGKRLAVEFVDAQEVKYRMEGPPPTQPPVAPVSIGPQSGPAQPFPRQQLGLRQKHPQPQQPILPPLPQISNMPPPERERVYVPPPSPLAEKVEAPIMTLDDLFRKTKATPRIYYLPLPEEQVKLKLEALSRN